MVRLLKYIFIFLIAIIAGAVLMPLTTSSGRAEFSGYLGFLDGRVRGSVNYLLNGYEPGSKTNIFDTNRSESLDESSGDNSQVVALKKVINELMMTAEKQDRELNLFTSGANKGDYSDSPILRVNTSGEISMDLQRATEVNQALEDGQDMLLSKVVSCQKQVETVTQELAECQVSSFQNIEIKGQSEAKISQLEDKVRELQAALLLRNTELAQMGASRKNGQRAFPKVSPQRRVKRPVALKSDSYNSKVRTVRVIVPKAILRVGPGREHGQAMEISKGARLIVEAREGEWLRVIGPTGKRVFIRADLVTDTADNKSSLKIMLDSPAVPPLKAPLPRMVPFGTISKDNMAQGSPVEQAAFQKLKSGVAKRGY